MFCLAIDSLASQIGDLQLAKAYITQSQKSKPQLYSDGFYFRGACSSAGNYQWRCIQTTLKCKATCTTHGNSIGSTYDMVGTSSTQHTHAPDTITFSKLEKRRKLKAKASASDEPPRKIIASLVNEITDREATANYPTADADRQVIHRIKNKLKPTYPPTPTTLSDIELPDFLMQTFAAIDGTGELFLLHDSGAIDKTRFFLFATQRNLDLLSGAHWFADGTFDIAPPLFLQVYTIHAFIHGRCQPLIYCVLPKKTQKMYVDVLKIVKTRLSSDPISITSDFEKAFLNACASVFEKVTLFGCFFHFKQSMWRKIGELGLTVTYKEDASVRKCLKMVQFLAFIPIADVVDVFEELTAEIGEMDVKVVEFFNYFETNYIGKLSTKTTGRGKAAKTITSRSTPLFSIELWNINSRLQNCLPRTNNFTESWHNAFSGMLRKHPSIYALIDAFRSEQKRTEDNIVKLTTGCVHKRRDKFVELDECMKNVMEDYSRTTYNDTFDKMTLLLQYTH